MNQSIQNLPWYKLQSQILPQPLAFIMGRIVRADRVTEQVDCIRRAAETLTRYVAITLASSITYSENKEPSTLTGLKIPENFSWGWYIEIIRKISKLEANHPLKSLLVHAMKASPSKSYSPNSSGNSAIDILENFISTRNSITDHSLVGMDEHKAMQLLEESNWEEKLRDLIKAFHPLLSLPLIVISGRKYIKLEKSERYRIFHYIGENDPYPLEIMGKSALIEVDIPYIILRHRLICLSPGMVVDSWSPHRKGLYFIDGIKTERPRYRTIFNDVLKYRGSSEGWPCLEWCEQENHEQIVTLNEKNLRRQLADEFASVHSDILTAINCKQ